MYKYAHSMYVFGWQNDRRRPPYIHTHSKFAYMHMFLSPEPTSLNAVI